MCTYIYIAYLRWLELWTLWSCFRNPDCGPSGSPAKSGHRNPKAEDRDKSPGGFLPTSRLIHQNPGILWLMKVDPSKASYFLGQKNPPFLPRPWIPWIWLMCNTRWITSGNTCVPPMLVESYQWTHGQKKPPDPTTQRDWRPDSRPGIQRANRPWQKSLRIIWKCGNARWVTGVVEGLKNKRVFIIKYWEMSSAQDLRRGSSP